MHSNVLNTARATPFGAGRASPALLVYALLPGLVVQPVLRPSATPAANLQLSLPLPPLAAPVSNIRLASAALPPARPRANPPARIGVFSPGSTGGKHPACTVCYALPIDWLLTFQLALASGLQLGLRLLPTHIWCRPSARQVLRLPVLTGFRRNLRLAPAAAAAPTRAGGCPLLPTPASNLRLASAALLPALPVSAHSACAASAYLRLGL